MRGVFLGIIGKGTAPRRIFQHCTLGAASFSVAPLCAGEEKCLAARASYRDARGKFGSIQAAAASNGAASKRRPQPNAAPGQTPTASNGVRSQTAAAAQCRSRPNGAFLSAIEKTDCDNLFYPIYK